MCMAPPAGLRHPQAPLSNQEEMTAALTASGTWRSMFKQDGLDPC